MANNTVDSGGKPQQRLPYSEKIANKDKWGKDVINYYLKLATFHSESNGKSGKDLGMLYKLHNNEIPDYWFKSTLNPFNVQNEAHKNQPATIRKTNIARPVIEKLLGEYTKRPFSYFVNKVGEEGYNKYFEQLTGKLQKNLEQHFINNLDPEVFAKAQQEQQEVPKPEIVKEQFDDSYLDSEAMEASKLLVKIMEDLYFYEKSRSLFKDFVITGEEYTQKDIQDDQIVYERISPLDVWYIKSYYSPYIEDGEVCSRRYLLSPSEIVDKFYREITKEQLDIVEKSELSTSFYSSSSSFLSHLTDMNNNNMYHNKIPIYYVTWKSQKEICFVLWTDEFGQEFEDVQSEDYVKNPDRNEKLEWRWINEVWEGYKIGKEDYLGIKPIPYQRNELNNISKCKLPINGRCYSDEHASNISIYELMIEWVKLFIICNYRLERMIAKSKDKILLIDKNVIPNDGEWDEEKFFYYADALGFGLVDRTQQGVDRNLQYQVLDMRLYEDISQMINLLDWIKQQCYDTVGFNAQRLGEIAASETATNATNASYASAVITEDLFIKHEEFLERELQGLLDLSRIAYRDGYKSLTYSDDRRMELININPDVNSYLDLCIKVTNNSKQIERLNQIKQLIQPYLQNGGKMSNAIEVVEAENTIKIKHILRTIERKEQEQLDAQAQNEQQSQQQHEQEQLQLQQEYAEINEMFAEKRMNAEYDRKEQLAYIDGDIAMELANITATGKTGDGDTNDNGILDINEIQKRAVDREKIYHDKQDNLNKDQIANKQLDLKNKEIMLKDKQHSQKMKAEEAKTKAQIQVARMRPKPSKK